MNNAVNLNIDSQSNNTVIGEKSQSKIDYFTEFKNNIHLEDNSSFFKRNVVMRYNTGSGKTYNSAYLALYTLFYTNKRIVISTTKNENVEDLMSEIKELLKIFTTPTPITEKFFEKPLLKNIRINKMVSYNQISKEKFEETRVIITNHSYFFPNGNSSSHFKNIKKLTEVIGPEDIFIIDEVDEYEKQALSTISLNDFYKICHTPAGEILRPATNCFISHEKQYYIEHINSCRYSLPVENTKVRFTKEGDFNTPTYVLDRESEFDLETLVNEFYFESLELEDVGRRIGFNFDAHSVKYKLLRVVKCSLLKPNEIKHVNIESDDFLKLVNNSHGLVRVEQIVRLLDPITEEKIIDLDTREDFIEWCIANMSTNQFDKLLTRINAEGKDLYKRFVIIRRKSALDTIEATKYYITATPSNLIELGYELENGKERKVNTIENIDIFFINRNISLDKLVKNIAIDGISNYKNDINCLAFCAEKRNIDRAIKEDRQKYKDDLFSGIRIVTSIQDGTIDMKPSPIGLGKTEAYNTIKNYSILSYLNGTEATGKNYCEANLCVINTKPEINVLGRLTITNDSFSIIDIEVASFRTIIQAGGRIERTNKEQKYKSIIFIGDDESIIDRYIEEKAGNGINYNFMESKTIKLGEKYLKQKLVKIMDHIKSNINCDFEQMQMNNNYDDDKRSKYNHADIMKYFLFLLSNDVTEKEAKKQTIYKFDISRKWLNEIIKKKSTIC